VATEDQTSLLAEAQVKAYGIQVLVVGERIWDWVSTEPKLANSGAGVLRSQPVVPQVVLEVPSAFFLWVVSCVLNARQVQLVPVVHHLLGQAEAQSRQEVKQRRAVLAPNQEEHTRHPHCTWISPP